MYISVGTVHLGEIHVWSYLSAIDIICHLFPIASIIYIDWDAKPYYILCCRFCTHTDRFALQENCVFLVNIAGACNNVHINYKLGYLFNPLVKGLEKLIWRPQGIIIVHAIKYATIKRDHPSNVTMEYCVATYFCIYRGAV